MPAYNEGSKAGKMSYPNKMAPSSPKVDQILYPATKPYSSQVQRAMTPPGGKSHNSNTSY